MWRTVQTRLRSETIPNSKSSKADGAGPTAATSWRSMVLLKRAQWMPRTSIRIQFMWAMPSSSRDGNATKVFVELRDVNYPGSIYTLTYEASSDQLKGIYYQA